MVDLAIDVPARLAVAGVSAGGLLSAAVCLASRDRGGPDIAAQILLYPVIDDDFDTESYRCYGEGCYNSAAAMARYWDQSAPGKRDDPLVTPSKADSLAGLPPAVVVSAELDPPLRLRRTLCGETAGRRGDRPCASARWAVPRGADVCEVPPDPAGSVDRLGVDRASPRLVPATGFGRAVSAG